MERDEDNGFPPPNPWRHAFTANLASGLIITVLALFIGHDDPNNWKDPPGCQATQTVDEVQIADAGSDLNH
jgi:hypothetical protein